MSFVTRLWFVACCAVVGAIALIQAWDATRWITGPWPHFTLRDHGVVMTRGLDDAPPSLRALLATSPLVLRDVQPGAEGAWLPIARVGDAPMDARVRLRAALSDLPRGAPARVRVEDATGRVSEAEVTVDRLPARIALERIGCFAGVGLCIAAFGLLVFALRPDSRVARPFLTFSLLMGLQGVTTQVVGGYPSRLHWLSIGLCYVGPITVLALILSLEERPWLTRHSWMLHLPWLIAPVAMLAAVVQGSIHDDVSLPIRVVRLGLLGAGAIVLAWLRITARTRQEARRTEFFVVGLLIAYIPVIYAYSQPGISDANPPSAYYSVTMLAYPLTIGYGIVSGHLFDIGVVIRRAAALASLVVVGAATFALLLVSSGSLLGSVEVRQSTPLLAAFVAIAFLVGGSLHGRLRGLVDRVINPARFGHAKALRDAGVELAALDEPIAIADRLSTLATGALGLNAASVMLSRGGSFQVVASSGAVPGIVSGPLAPTDALVRLTTLTNAEVHRRDFESNPKLVPLRDACLSRLDELGADLALPLSSSSGDVFGLLALGGRSDGAPMNADDVALFRSLAAQGSRALEIARGATSASPPRPADATTDMPAPLGAGAVLGHYRIEAHVGRGGMGTVYRAMDERLQRRVALKFLADGGHDERMLDRVRREARVLASLDHPSIVRIHALEEIGGHLFLVMEYLDGHTLQTEVDERGPLPLDAALEATTCVATALDHALSLGVLHRDVKPANVMRGRDGSLKLMDFGLARGGGHESVTGAGRLVGTLAYVAPELIAGGQASAQSDLYALGVTLHVLVTGRPLAGVDGRPWYLARDEVGVATLSREGVPQGAIPLLERLLRRRPEERPASPAALLAELAGLRRAMTGTA